MTRYRQTATRLLLPLMLVALSAVDVMASASGITNQTLKNTTRTGCGAVNSADILGVKAKSAAVDQNNFRFDLNLSGTIDRADVSMAKARSGMLLP